MADPPSCSHFASNPDVSGVGVRSAIYAQNLLCFAPVVSALLDKVVSPDEVDSIKDQSIGMLAMAFAILITAIVEATNNSGNRINGFDATIILDMSWMNNTSTFIWFLLYVHHRSEIDRPKSIPDIWSIWTENLRWLCHLRTGTQSNASRRERRAVEQDEPQGSDSGWEGDDEMTKSSKQTQYPET